MKLLSDLALALLSALCFVWVFALCLAVFAAFWLFGLWVAQFK